MTAVGSFPGIGSSFDYTSLVNSMINIASQPGTAMQTKITTEQSQLTEYQNYSSLLSTLKATTATMRDGSAFQAVSANVSNATGANGQSVLSASSLSGASPGTYSVQVLQTAQAEKLSGGSFSGSSTPLGISGDFVVNGRTVTLVASDTLSSVASKINAVNSGSNASHVSAAIVTDSANSQRIVLTSTQTGSAGINLVDGSQGVAQQLGWVDSTESIKHATSAGAQSDNFASTTATIASQLGLSASPGPQTVTIAGQSVSINLSTDSLTSIAASLSAVPGIQATVQSTTVNGATQYYLDVRNTTSFVDSGNTLQQLGILAAGRSSVTQQLQSSAMTDGNASTPATASTLLTNLWNGGAASGTQVGDTLTIAGTRGDGSAVNVAYTVTAGSTVGDLLNALNATTGFGAGTRPATASIDAGGHIVVSDGTAGQSSLSLQMVANNQGGGRLDFGALATTTTGRSRELVQGADAKFSVDGVAFTRSSNSVSDVIANTTLNLTGADPNVTATVNVALDSTAAQTAVQNYVTAYNAVVDYIKTQQTPGTDPTSNPTLYNDTLLRQARSALSQSMLSPVSGAASDMATPDMVGISLTATGDLSFDTTKFQTAFTTRYNDLTTLFMESGNTTDPSLVYTASSSATQPGNYVVNITQAAAQAQVSGTGFSGVYSQPGTPDSMTVTDLGSNASSTIQLAGGMTTAQIVAALSASFGSAQALAMQSSTTLNDATRTAAATSSTLLTALHASDGTSARVAAGDTISFSGTGTSGTPFTGTFTVGASSTLADFVTQLQSSVGTGATVSLVNGQISVQSNTSGASPLTLSLTANNEGGGSLNLGTMNVTAAGHGLLSLNATAVGNQIQIQGNAYGSGAGFSISYSGSGDPATQLGIAAGSSHGSDVQGTIGGYAATGLGRQLVGATGTPVDGLSLAYIGTSTGAIGSLSLTEGMGAVVDRLLQSWTQTGGTVAMQTQQINDTISTQQTWLANFNARIALQKTALLAQYSAMDSAVSQILAQGNSFLSAFSNLNNATNGNSSSSSSGSSSTSSTGTGS